MSSGATIKDPINRPSGAESLPFEATPITVVRVVQVTEGLKGEVTAVSTAARDGAHDVIDAMPLTRLIELIPYLTALAQGGLAHHMEEFFQNHPAEPEPLFSVGDNTDRFLGFIDDRAGTSPRRCVFCLLVHVFLGSNTIPDPLKAAVERAIVLRNKLHRGGV
jgi:hypothetical protein